MAKLTIRYGEALTQKAGLKNVFWKKRAFFGALFLCLILSAMVALPCFAETFGEGLGGIGEIEVWDETEVWEEEEDLSGETVTIIWHSNIPGEDETMEDTDFADGDYIDWYPFDEWEWEGMVAVGFSANPDDPEPIPFADADENYYDICAQEGEELYLVWREAVTVTLHGNGGLAALEPDDEEEEEIAEPVYEGDEVIRDNIVRGGSYFLDDSSFGLEGQLISSWEDEDGRIYEGGALYRFDEDVDLTACWAPARRVTLDPNGGFWRWEGTEQAKTFAYPEGKEVTPSEADRDGYVLFGWSDEPDGENVVNKYGTITVTDDMTLYALWRESVTVSFDGNGGRLVGSNAVKVEKGASLVGYKVPDLYYPEDDHMTFVGWALHRDDTKPLSVWDYLFEKDTTLYALWEEGRVITFDLNGGRRKADLADVFIMPMLEDSIIFSSQYYYDIFSEGDKVFVGWTTKRDDPGTLISQGQDLYAVHDDVTLYALWTDGCKVTFHGNGGKVVDVDLALPQDQVVVEMVRGERPEYYPEVQPGLKGETLLGWSTDPEGENLVWNATTMETDLVVDKSMDLYAVWVPAHTVRFHGNGKNIDLFGGTEDMIIDLWPEGEVIGHFADSFLPVDWLAQLEGWSVSPDGSSLIDPESFAVTEDLDLYAIWK